MAFTMQQVVDKGRIPINDSDKQRMSDAVGLSFAQDAILLLQSKRPDLLFGRYLTMPNISALALNSQFPLDDTLVPAVADYITARAEAGNDESVLEQRAAMFFSLFGGNI